MNAMTRISFLAAIVISLSGCGSSNSAGSGASGDTGALGGNNHATVTVNFTGVLPTAVATKIGPESFTRATLSASTLSLQIPYGITDFEVAFVCPTVTIYVGAVGTITAGFSGIAFRAPRLPNDWAPRLRNVPAPDHTRFYSTTTEEVFAATTYDGTSFTTGCSNPAAASNTTGTLTGTVDVSAVPGFEALDVMAVNESSGVSTYYQDIQMNSYHSFELAAPVGNDRVILVAEVSRAGGGGLCEELESPSGSGGHQQWKHARFQRFRRGHTAADHVPKPFGRWSAAFNYRVVCAVGHTGQWVLD